MKNPVTVIENHLRNLPEQLAVHKKSITNKLKSKTVQPTVLRENGQETIEYRILSAKQKILSIIGLGDASIRRLLRVIDSQKEQWEDKDPTEEEKKLAFIKTEDFSHTLYLHIMGKRIGKKISLLSQKVLTHSHLREKYLNFIHNELESINGNEELIYLVFQSVPLEILITFPLSPTNNIRFFQLETIRNRISSVNRATRVSLRLDEDETILKNDAFSLLAKEWKRLVQKTETQTQIQLLRTFTGIKTFNKSYIHIAD